MPILGLFLVFLVLPVAELYVILKVGDSIGILWTLLLLAADSVLGTLLLRAQGRTVWRRFNAALSEGRMPHREVMDGVLVIFGGAFLITPGFITDILGVLLLLPPTRAIVRRLIVQPPRTPGDRRHGGHPSCSRLRRGRERERARPATQAARAVSAPALAVAFYDHARELYGSARSGATVLFEGRRPSVLPEGPEVEAVAGGWSVRLSDRVSLEFERLAPEADLDGVSATVCRVHGEVAGKRVDGLGTVAETHSLPAWDELDSLRTVSALADEEHALVALARRPRGAAGHDEESVTARLLDDGRLLDVETARISTVYDGGGRQRSAGLELWIPGEEYPRRGSGLVLAGSSLDLDGIQVHAAIFRWRLDGRDATGAYELMVRTDPPAAA